MLCLSEPAYRRVFAFPEGTTAVGERWGSEALAGDNCLTGGDLQTLMVLCSLLLLTVP